MKTNVIIHPSSRRLVIKKIMLLVRRERSKKLVRKYCRQFYTDEMRSKIKLVKGKR